MTSTQERTSTSQLRALLESRMAVVDGVWGIMFQNVVLKPED